MNKIFQLYYIPGYPGVPSDTASKLKHANPDLIELNYDPALPNASLLDMFKVISTSDAHPVIIASSLGGWYAENLACWIPCDLILWNPSLQPNVKKYGINAVYSPMVSVTPRSPRSVFLGTLDDVVPMDCAKSIYENIANINILEEGHRMTDFGISAIQTKIGEHQCFLSENS